MRIEISSRASAFAGTSFGDVGAYEKISGRLHGAVDPHAPENEEIINLDRAPRNRDGLVEYAVDFVLLIPVDLTRGNRHLLFDSANRGDKLALVDLNSASKGPGSNAVLSAADAGNGFLMRQGYSILWSAWQGGVAAEDHKLRADFPIARDGVAPIIATVREEIIFGHSNSPTQAPLSYPAASLDPAGATLTVRQYETDLRQPVAASAWRWRSPQLLEIDLVDGYASGAIYEFIYSARDPIVMGLGFLAVRDVVSFMRYQAHDAAGVANPLNLAGVPAASKVITYGRSQPGRFLREFVRLGFNQDSAGRRVFDGIFTAIAGSRRIYLNEAFAQPGRFHRQHEDHSYPGDQFPFTYATRQDSYTGERGGILERALATATCPKIIHIDSSTEFWQGRSSLLVTDELGRDVPTPDEVRLYLFTGTQHAGPAMLGHAGIFSQNPQYPLNYVDYSPLNRALIVALDRWVSDLEPAPPSRFPRVSDATLVAPFPPSMAGFPHIPGVCYPTAINELSVMDYTQMPPRAVPAQRYPVLVSKLDADGNEIAGIRLPDVAVPRATLTGWNLRDREFAEGALMLVGACFPFALTAAERQRNGDPRLSLAERYPSASSYVSAVRACAEQLGRERLLLAEDIERIVARAAALAH